MKFIDLETQYHQHKADIDRAITRVLEHGQFILGPEVQQLEEELAARANVAHCVGLSDGTIALQLALTALEIGPGDEVIVPAFSFFASASTVLMVGAKPVFVDIDARTYNIDVNLIEAAITPKTRAIIPVDLFGQPADYAAILAIAKKHQLRVIADGAQSFGATYNHKPVGSFGDITCVSFYPAKVLGAYGEAGACFTQNDELARRLKILRNQGQDGGYHHVMLSGNHRLDTLHAAILLAKLRFFDQELAHRRKCARLYDELLQGLVKMPYIAPSSESCYAQYTIEVDHRDVVRKELAAQGIPTAVHYPKGLHQQPVMLERGITGSFPVTERAAERVLSLPMSGYLTEDDLRQVVEGLRKVI